MPHRKGRGVLLTGGATTVYSHIYRLLHKLGVHSRHDAVAAALRLRQAEASMRTSCGVFRDAHQPIGSVQEA